MSLNDITLSTRNLADLYPSSLIEQVAGGQNEKIKFLGKNEKNILVILSKENVAFIEEDELNFLSTVLSDCRLSLADVAIVNLKQTPGADYRIF